MGDPGDPHSHGRRYQRSQSETPSSGSSRAGRHSYEHSLSDPPPRFPAQSRYFHVSGTPLHQSPDPYPSQQQLHAPEAQPQFYPPWPIRDPAMHHTYPQFSASGQASSARYDTASDYPTPPPGYPASVGHTLSSGPNSLQYQAPGRYDAETSSSEAQCLPTGDLHISVHKARDIKGREIWNRGKADPYVELTLDDQKQKTKTHTNAGSNPIWNQILPFLVKSVDTKYNKLSIKIYNANYNLIREDNVLGYLTLSNLGQSILQNRTKLSAANWYPVFRHDEKKGEILLAFRFFPSSEAQMLNNLGNEVRPAENVENDPKAEYTLLDVGGGVLQIMLQGAAVGLAVAAL